MLVVLRTLDEAVEVLLALLLLLVALRGARVAPPALVDGVPRGWDEIPAPETYNSRVGSRPSGLLLRSVVSRKATRNRLHSSSEGRALQCAKFMFTDEPLTFESAATVAAATAATFAADADAAAAIDAAASRDAACATAASAAAEGATESVETEIEAAESIDPVSARKDATAFGALDPVGEPVTLLGADDGGDGGCLEVDASGMERAEAT